MTDAENVYATACDLAVARYNSALAAGAGEKDAEAVGYAAHDAHVAEHDLVLLREQALQHLKAIKESDRILRHAKRTSQRLLSERRQLGELLAGVRKRWPASGPASAGWAEFCRSIKINKRTAARYIKVAERFAEKLCDNLRHSSEVSQIAAPNFHILIATGEFKKRVAAALDRWPVDQLQRDRKWVATHLREMADQIENHGHVIGFGKHFKTACAGPAPSQPAVVQ